MTAVSAALGVPAAAGGPAGALLRAAAQDFACGTHDTPDACTLPGSGCFWDDNAVRARAAAARVAPATACERTGGGRGGGLLAVLGARPAAPAGLPVRCQTCMRGGGTHPRRALARPLNRQSPSCALDPNTAARSLAAAALCPGSLMARAFPCALVSG